MELIPKTGFFEVQGCEAKKNKAVLVSDSDIPSVISINSSVIIYEGEYENKPLTLILAIIPKKVITEMTDATLTKKGLSKEEKEGLKLSSYRGAYYDELFTFYPELKGTEVTGQDEDGNDILTNIVKRTRVRN